MSSSQMNIGIVGLGLIGGSLGFDLRSPLSHIAPKDKSCQYRVFGVSRRESTCASAIALGCVDDASVDLALLATADVVFICTPLAAIVPTVKQLIPHLAPDTVLTDVGSVKAPIVEACSQFWPNFVGGHPMAGTADSGIEAAVRALFAQKPYILTPTPTTPPAAVKTVEGIARSLAATIYHCHPNDHDRAVSWISHLPVMVSASLIAACTSDDRDVLKLAHLFASSGFRDTSRVGGGNPELGVMMARYNKQELLRSLSIYRQNLDRLIDSIQREDWMNLEQQLKSTQQSRPEFIDVISH